MNAETLIIECGVLAVDICLSYLVYNLYKSSAKCLKSLQEAQCFEIDSSLQQKIESSNGVVEYAVISGNIRSLILPISPASLAPPFVNKQIEKFYRYFQREMCERIAKKFKAEWNAENQVVKSWSSTIHDIIYAQFHFIIAPFALCSKSRDLFKKQVLVEVLEPYSGLKQQPQFRQNMLSLSKEFIPHEDVIDVAVLGFFRKEITIGLPEFKGILFEDQALTAVGKLVLENNKMKIMPPDNGLTYFVTSLDVESLINKISSTTKFYKIASIVMGTLTLALLVCVTRRAFSEIKRRIDRSQGLNRLEELRQRRMSATSKMVMYAHVVLAFGILFSIDSV